MRRELTVVFRCDASPDIGSGHVIRCLTLANALHQSGWKTIFACDKNTLETLPFLAETSHDFMDEKDLGKEVDLLIVDHYGLDITFEKSARAWAKYIAVIDDLADRKHDCDLLIDQTYGRRKDDYSEFIPKKSDILLGTDYALLRPQFSNVRPNALMRRHANMGKIEKILVFMSGTDPKNSTEFVLDALESLEEGLSIDVILGASAPFLNSVRQKIETLKNDITLHINVENMEEFMAEADLCIGSGGTASWERCSVGLPTILIEIADNQTKISEELDRVGALIHLGKIEKINVSLIKNAIKNLIENPQDVIRMSQVAQDICDGMGTKNAVQAIEMMVK